MIDQHLTTVKENCYIKVFWTNFLLHYRVLFLHHLQIYKKVLYNHPQVRLNFKNKEKDVFL